MLSKFSVSNYKSFKDKITIDFKSDKFNFNSDAISQETNLVKTAIIYGKNGSGKSNLGLAIFDIVCHLTPHKNTSHKYKLNFNSDEKKSSFCYEFKFDNDIVTYEYSKNEKAELLKEILKINDRIILHVNRSEDNLIIVNLEGTENLNKDLSNSTNLSIVNYVKNNSILNVKIKDHSIFNKFNNFVDKMLYFKSLQENDYFGYEQGNNFIHQDILDKKHLKDFESLLNEAGIKCQLEEIDSPVGKEIGFRFKDEVVSFNSIASAGSQSLLVFYYWLQRIESVKEPFLIFIDEFDAFYHFELAQLLVKKLKSTNKQIILTTHNTDVMTNDLLRPDCYYILCNNKVKSLNKLTEKELREIHNLSKLYKAGTFICE